MESSDCKTCYCVGVFFLFALAPPLSAEIFFEQIGPSGNRLALDTFVRGVSGNGQVAVGRTPGGAFRWTRDDGFNVFSSVAVSAWDASFDGSVIVGKTKNDFAFRWSEADGLTELQKLDSTTRSIARAVSDDGSVIVGDLWAEEAEETVFTAARWANGAVEDLGWLGDTAEARASGVSADGSTVVGASNYIAFRWTTDLGMQSLGTLGGTSQAYSASQDGSHITGTAQAEGFTSVEGFLWSETLGMNSLGERSPGGFFWRQANDISADGRLVVGQQNGEGELAGAFIWTPESGPRMLIDVLRNDFGLDEMIEGWRLNSAVAVSNDGRTIVGFGENPSGRLASWVVSIPEPNSDTLLVLGLLLLVPTKRIDEWKQGQKCRCLSMR